MTRVGSQRHGEKKGFKQGNDKIFSSRQKQALSKFNLHLTSSKKIIFICIFCEGV
jgi:hypothetical protein